MHRGVDRRADCQCVAKSQRPVGQAGQSGRTGDLSGRCPAYRGACPAIAPQRSMVRRLQPIDNALVLSGTPRLPRLPRSWRIEGAS